MSIDHVGKPSSGFMGQLPKQSLVSPGMAPGSDPAGNDWQKGLGLGLAASTARGLDRQSYPNLLDTWSHKGFLWGGNRFAEEVGNKVGNNLANLLHNNHELESNVRKAVQAKHGFDTKKTIFKQEMSELSYRQILRVDHNPLQKLSWTAYKDTVRRNCQHMVAGLRNEGLKGFFANEEITFKEYLKETVYKHNLKPIREMFMKDGPSNNKWGTSLIRSLCGALMVGDIIKTSHTEYKNAQSREDGSLSSRIKTWTATTKAFALKTLKSLTCWEVGGFGFAIGQAALPFLLPIPIIGVAVPLGGIILGSLAGTLTYMALNKVIPDPKPHYQRQLKTQVGANPFKHAAV